MVQSQTMTEQEFWKSHHFYNTVKGSTNNSTAKSSSDTTDITTTIVQYKTDWPFNKEQKSNISPDIQLPPGQPFPRN